MIESNILIVCDEPMTGRIWGLLLADFHCMPVITNSLSQALAASEETAPDLIIVDIKSRGSNGVEICKALRDQVTSPLIMLTPINNESHTLEIYQAGADECIVKPISPELFLAKVKVWLRRSWTVQVESLDRLMIGSMTLEPARHTVVNTEGKNVRLSNLEFRVLHLLMSHPSQHFSNEEIIRRVWGFYSDGNSALVKNVIYRLRKKIEPNPDEARYICTETGGYLFRR